MRIIPTCLLCLIANVAFAVPVTWTLQNVSNNLTGSFVFDADAPITNSVPDVNGTVYWADNAYSDVDIGFNGNPAFNTANVDYLDCTYAFVDSVDEEGNKSWYYEGCSTSDANQLRLFIPFGFQGVTAVLSFAEPLSNAGGTVAFTGGLYGDASGTFSGVIVASAVPVPAAVWLFGSALAMLAWVRGKRTAPDYGPDL